MIAPVCECDINAAIWAFCISIIAHDIRDTAVLHKKLDSYECMSLTAEEYLVFTNRFFVLDRTRINYWLELQCADNSTTVKLTRINYWYEEERDGGIKFSAEEMITDENAFNKKGKLLKDQGKFRRKTIDFFEECVEQISQQLN